MAKHKKREPDFGSPALRIVLGSDRAVEIAVMGIARQRLGWREGSVAFDREPQMPADLGQLRQIDIAEFRVGVPQIAEAEGDTPGVGR